MLRKTTKKFWGPSSNSKPVIQPPPARQQFPSPRPSIDGNTKDPVEDELLGSLELLAQKTEVLAAWADNLYETVRAVPQSAFHHNYPCISADKFHSLEPIPDPSKFAKKPGERDKDAGRRKNAEVQVEMDAMTAIAVYMLLMTFCQKAIDKLKNYHEHIKMRDPHGDLQLEPSEGFYEGEGSLPLLQ